MGGPIRRTGVVGWSSWGPAGYSLGSRAPTFPGRSHEEEIPSYQAGAAASRRPDGRARLGSETGGPTPRAWSFLEEEVVIVILEGPDGSGKTHLAHRLQKEFKLGYWHEGPTPEDQPPVIYYCQKLWSFRDNHMVLDRFALGERVYGPIVRKRDRLGESGWATFQKVCDDLDVIQIVCLPPYHICLKTWENRQDEEWLETTRLLLETYATFAHFTLFDDNLFPYDWTQHSEDRLMQWVEMTYHIKTARRGGRV